MDAQTAARRLDEIQLVDVRYESDWRGGHIEGAVNIPEDDLEDRLGELDRSRPVVTICRAGSRSGDAAGWLRSRGIDADNLDGGMLAWKWAGLPITAPIAEPGPESEQEMQGLHDEFLEVALAMQERFGVGVEPSEDQIREFLRDRLVRQGKTPEEAEAFLAELGPE